MPSVPSRADEELLQVVAGVVLAQAAQPVPDAAVGEHHFEPEHEVARIAIAQHRVPPALVDRLPPIVQLPSAASDSGNSMPASAAACWTAASVTPASAVTVAFARSSARMARSCARATTRSHGRTHPASPRRTCPVLPPWGTIGACASRTRSDHRGDLRRVGGAHDGARRTAVTTTPVDDVRLDIGGCREDVGGADDRCESFRQGCTRIAHGAGY